MVAMNLCVRSADFSDGHLTETPSTVNASRDGFYFLTSVNRYHRGMRLQVSTSSGAEAGTPEDIGEVVRVDRRSDGFGVAVKLMRPASRKCQAQRASMATQVQSQTKEQSSATEAPAGSERRSSPRQPFIAVTEVIDIGTGAKSLARTADLSAHGCYIDTLQPFPVGTVVRLEIQKGQETVSFRALVSSCHVGSGMGLVFDRISPGQRTILSEWLRQDAQRVEPLEATPAAAASEKSDTAVVHADFAVRLLRVLRRKKVLTDSEADALLIEALV
jgi:hypothetical protein